MLNSSEKEAEGESALTWWLVWLTKGSRGGEAEGCAGLLLTPVNGRVALTHSAIAPPPPPP